MKILKTFMIPVFLLFGCSSNHIIQHSQSDYKTLNEELQGEECDMIVNENEKITARNIGIFRDSLYCIDSNSNTEIIFHTSAIKKIIITQNTRGALEGGGIGALIGMGLIASSPDTEKEGGIISYEAALIVGAIGGGLWGLGIGALIGHDETYVFETSPDSTKLK